MLRFLYEAHHQEKWNNDHLCSKYNIITTRWHKIWTSYVPHANSKLRLLKVFTQKVCYFNLTSAFSSLSNIVWVLLQFRIKFFNVRSYLIQCWLELRCFPTSMRWPEYTSWRTEEWDILEQPYFLHKHKQEIPVTRNLDPPLKRIN